MTIADHAAWTVWSTGWDGPLSKACQGLGRIRETLRLSIGVANIRKCRRGGEPNFPALLFVNIIVLLVNGETQYGLGNESLRWLVTGGRGSTGTGTYLSFSQFHLSLTPYLQRPHKYAFIS